MKAKVVRSLVDLGEDTLNEALKELEGLGATVRLVSSAIWGDGFDAHVVYSILYEDPLLTESGPSAKFLAS